MAGPEGLASPAGLVQCRSVAVESVYCATRVLQRFRLSDQAVYV